MPLQNIEFNVTKAIDVKAFRRLIKGALEVGLPVDSIVAHAPFQAEFKIDVVDGEYNTEQFPALEKIFTQETMLLSSIVLNLNGNARIRYSRHPDKATDVVGFELGRWTADPDEVRGQITDYLAYLKKALVAVESKEYLSSILGDDLQQHFQYRETELEKLKALSENVTIQVSEYRERLDEKFHQRENALNTSIEKQKEKLTAGFDKKHEELQAREEALQQKLAEIDDRDNRHARRDIRNWLLGELKSRQDKFRLSAGTRRLRWPIHGILILVLTVLGLFNAIIFDILLKTNLSEGVQWALIVKQSVAALAFGGFVVYYLRWCNLWFQQHATEEFRHKRLELDIDRASWLVEVALEWKNETKDVIPTILLDRLSKDLFSDDSHKPTDEPNPADQLASAILGNSAQVKIKAGNNEVCVDRKGLNKLAKE